MIYSNFQDTSSSVYNASYPQNEYFHFYYAIEHSSYTFPSLHDLHLHINITFCCTTEEINASFENEDKVQPE